MANLRTWSKETRYLGLIIGIIVSIGLIWYFRDLVSPLMVAGLLAYILHPAVVLISNNTKISRRVSVIIVYVLSLVILTATIGILTPILLQEFQDLDMTNMLIEYENFRSEAVHIFDWVFFPDQFLPPVLDVPADLLNPLAENIFEIIGVLTKNFTWVLVIIVATYYFLQDWTKIVEWLIRISPETYRYDMRIIFKQLADVWSAYLRTQLAFMLVVGVVDSIVWLAIGLPGAIILGMLTGLTSFVHEIGAVVSGVLSVLVALINGSNFLQMSNLWFALLVFILYMVLTGIKNIWLRPIIVGRGVHIHAGVVFVVVIGALIFHGALAAFLIVPVLVSILIIGRYVRRRVLRLPPFPETDLVGAIISQEEDED